MVKANQEGDRLEFFKYIRRAYCIYLNVTLEVL